MKLKPKTKKSAPKAAPTTVDSYLSVLNHPCKPAVQAIRKVILGLDARIREEVKWNAPSFYIVEHFATFRLHPQPMCQLVLHAGAKTKKATVRLDVPDPEGLLKWLAPDRCIVTFTSNAEANRKAAALVQILERWIEQSGVTKTTCKSPRS